MSRGPAPGATRAAAFVLAAVCCAAPAMCQPARELPQPLRLLDAGGLKAEAAALVMSGQDGGEILVEVLALPLPGRGSDIRVPVVLEIDGSGLLAGHTGDLLQVEVSIYALDSRSGIRDALLKVVELNLAELRPKVAATGVKLAAELELAPGLHSLRVLVRNLATGAVGLRSLPLEIADRDRAGAVLLPPLVAQPTDPWVTVVVPPASGAEPLLRAAASLPSARPLVSAGSGLEMEVLSARLAGTPALLVELRDQQGEPAGRERVRLGLRSPSPFADLERSPATLPTEGLAPGQYLVRLVTPDRQVASPEIPLIVIERELAGQIGVWAELTATAGAPGPAPTPRDQQVTGGSKLQIPAGQVRSEFLAALRLLADGDLQGAKSSLVRMEEAALGGSGAAIVQLGKIELKALERLSRKDAESLVPVLRLYESLYHDNRAQARYLLSTHARILLMGMVDLYVDRSRLDDADRIAARFLTNLAAGLQRLGLDPFAVQIFREALALAPDSEVVLLSLASAYERRGGYAEAVDYLSRLLEAHPESPEARLRLALCRARMDERSEARELLEELVAEEAPEWIAAIAHQELAALLIAAGRLEEAREVVAGGLGRFPGDEKLALQNALLLDLARRPSAARDALAQGGETADGEPSPRFRYTLPPEDRLRGLEADLDALVDARLGSLQAVVSPDHSAASGRETGAVSP